MHYVLRNINHYCICMYCNTYCIPQALANMLELERLLEKATQPGVKIVLEAELLKCQEHLASFQLYEEVLVRLQPVRILGSGAQLSLIYYPIFH